MVHGNAIAAFQKRILTWYAAHGRDLPWRHTTDAYKILVSEIMLQQTQVDRVIDYYTRWIRIWPTIRKLARARPASVLSEWSGLGYNNRALRLHKLARMVEEQGGNMPSTYEELVSLPGIGPYTAHAVMAFAYNKTVPVVDTNIRRVLVHELGLDTEIGDKALQGIALRCVPPGRSREWHNALMDYGALEKTARSTGIKPLSQQSRFEGSDRQVRGWVMKRLTAGRPVTIELMKRSYPEKDIKQIIAGMEKDGIIRKQKEKLLLPN